MVNEKDRKKFKEMIEPFMRGKFDNFVQVECGYKHTLLLNNKGQVFSFGSGL